MELLSFVTDITAASGASLAKGIRGFIGPILMLIMGLVAITFLFRREMTQFMIFLGIAIVVAIVFYAPDFIVNLAKGVNKESGVGGKWN